MSFQSELKAGADAVQPRPYAEQSGRPIHVTTDMIGSPVPTQTVQCRAGLSYDMPHHLADVFVENGWGVEAPPSGSPSEPPADSLKPATPPSPKPLLESKPGGECDPAGGEDGDSKPGDSRVGEDPVAPAVKPFGKPGIPVVATKGEVREEFKSVGAAAKALGVNRKALDRALTAGSEVNGWKIERIESTED